MVIDSHVHFWQYDKVKDAWITDDMRVLQQHFLPEDFSPELKRNKIDGIVAVQAGQSETETLFLKDLAAKHPYIKGVVGWIDLQNKNIEERLQYFSQFPIIKGWRHIVQAEPDGFLTSKNFLRGIQALAEFKYTYDILVQQQQLKDALALINRFPQQSFVIDHCGKPSVKNNDITEWSRDMKEIAQNPNVYCKLSGLFTEAKWKEWSPVDFDPYLNFVFEYFGANRLLFGSDWPVLLLSGDYMQWKGLLQKFMERFDEEDRKKVFGTNAINFYQLEL